MSAEDLAVVGEEESGQMCSSVDNDNDNEDTEEDEDDEITEELELKNEDQIQGTV